MKGPALQAYWYLLIEHCLFSLSLPGTCPTCGGFLLRQPIFWDQGRELPSPLSLLFLVSRQCHPQMSDDRVFRQGLSFLLNFYNWTVRYYRHTQDGFGLPGSVETILHVQSNAVCDFESSGSWVLAVWTKVRRLIG